MHENKEEVRDLLRLVSFFIRAIVPRPFDDEDEGFSNVLRVEDEDYAEELGRLQFEYAEMEEARMRPILEETLIDDEASLVSVIGHSRLELVRSSGWTLSRSSALAYSSVPTVYHATAMRMAEHRSRCGQTCRT